MTTVEATSQILQLAISIVTLMTLIWGFAQMVKNATESRAERKILHDNVQKIELATNSMKDALVAATEKAAGMAGEQRGREQAAEARRKE